MSTEAAAAASEAPEKYYKFSSSDDIEFRISEKAVGQSVTLIKLISNVENGDAKIIPLDNVKGETLDLVFKWCEEYKDKPVPDDAVAFKTIVIPEFDTKLMDIPNNSLYQLMFAADYLIVKGLINVSCQKVANFSIGKNPEEMRLIYGISTDAEDMAAAARHAAAEQEAASAE